MATMRADPARAVLLCRTYLQGDDGNADAKLLLSEALRLSGDPKAAHAIVAPLAARDPNWFGAQRQLGVILSDLRQPVAAAAAFAAAASSTPMHPTIWRDLALQLALAGDEPGAQEARMRHADLPLAEPMLVRAGKMLRDNALAEAEALLQDYLRQFSEDVAALNLLAEAQARSDRADEAEATLRRCLRLAPRYRRGRHALAQLLLGASRLDEAFEEVRRLLALDPRSPGSNRLLGAIYVAMGNYDAALEVYEPLLKSDPSRPGVWMSYGHTLKTLNRTQEGIDAYKRAISIAPHLGEAYWSLANLKTVSFDDAEIAHMQAQAAREDIGGEDKVNFLFALGKAFEDRRDAARAFDYYSEGAKLHLSVSNYTPGRLDDVVVKSQKVFTREFFEERPGSGADSQDPIFIVGLPRAGSTLLEQILASHSMVEGTSELSDMRNIAQDLVSPPEARAGAIFVDRVPGLSANDLRAMGERYLKTTRMHRVLGRPLFINKMPNDFMHVGLIHLVLPNAKIIDARRHPMACGWSCFKQHFARGQLFTYDLAEIGRYYAGYVELMSHYDAVLPGRVHRVIHEELVADPEPAIRRLLEYCGLPFEEQCLNPHLNERAVKTASSEQVRQPISTRGFDSWRPYEPYLGPLKQALGSVLSTYSEPSK
ncbi:MAG: sulfotransferase [Alphaproteobacteria bacterium]|nr:sulfotransferase [Alphaproteobacteria bacterium]